MAATSLALALHIFGATVWVGGMFAAYMCLRLAAGALEPPQRLTLWRGFFSRFFAWVWLSIVLLLASGFWMVPTSFGGFGNTAPYINAMMALGIVMVVLFAWLFHGPWLKFKRAVDDKDWSIAGAQLERMRRIVMINLPLGILVVIIGGTGRYWH